MSIKISASLSDKYSLTFAAANAITRASLLSFLISLVLLLEWNTIEPASSSWCGTCTPRCSSDLCSKCSSLCGRCFGSRSHASTSQPPLQPIPQMHGVYVQSSWRMCSIRTETPRRLVFILLLVVLLPSTSCAPASSLFFSIECGRCSGSRSSAVLSYSVSFLISSITQGIDVHPSWRLCSIRAGTHRWFATVLLHCMLLSISCTSASSSVRLASAAAAFSLLTCLFAFFLVSCVSFPFCGGGFFSVNVFLASFFELGHFNTDVFSAWSRSSYSIVSCFSFYLWYGCSSQTWWSWK